MDPLVERIAQIYHTLYRLIKEVSCPKKVSSLDLLIGVGMQKLTVNDRRLPNEIINEIAKYSTESKEDEHQIILQYVGNNKRTVIQEIIEMSACLDIDYGIDTPRRSKRTKINPTTLPQLLPPQLVAVLEYWKLETGFLEYFCGQSPEVRFRKDSKWPHKHIGVVTQNVKIMYAYIMIAAIENQKWSVIDHAYGAIGNDNTDNLKPLTKQQILRLVEVGAQNCSYIKFYEIGKYFNLRDPSEIKSIIVRDPRYLEKISLENITRSIMETVVVSVENNIAKFDRFVMFGMQDLGSMLNEIPAQILDKELVLRLVNVVPQVLYRLERYHTDAQVVRLAAHRGYIRDAEFDLRPFGGLLSRSDIMAFSILTLKNKLYVNGLSEEQTTGEGTGYQVVCGQNIELWERIMSEHVRDLTLFMIELVTVDFRFIKFLPGVSGRTDNLQICTIALDSGARLQDLEFYWII